MRKQFVLIAIIVGQSTAFAQGVRYPLRQYLSIRGTAAPTISPDGQEVAFRTNMTGTSQVWKVSTKSGWPEQLTFFPSSVNSFKWSPRGDNILVTADDNGNEQFQMYLLKPDGTRITPLKLDPKVRHEFGGWSKDGRTVYYASNERDQRYFDCYLLDIDSGQSRRVFEKNAVLAAEALSPDGRVLAASDAKSNVDSDLYLVDTQTGRARRVTQHTGDVRYQAIGFSADSRTLYVSTNQGREFLNLAKMDVASGRIDYLREDSFEIENAVTSPDGRLLAYTMNRDGYEEPFLYDTVAEKPVKLPSLPHGIVTPTGFTANGRAMALTIMTPTRTADVWSLDLRSGKLQQATHSSYAGIDRETFTSPELIHFNSFDGRSIPAFLMMPKNAPANHSLPVILSVHGGPEAEERPMFNPLYQYFVSRGYAVLAPNIRGSSGYGKAYLAMDNGPKRWDALKDLQAAVDYVGSVPALDKNKVAIIGGSYGGFAVLAMLTHYPKTFAAGVDLFGIADFKTFLANTAPYRRPLRAAEYGDPERDSEFLDKVSPLRHADQIVSPLMVIQGAQDPRVPQSESEQIAKSVRERGGTVEYILFPDEGHGIAKLPNRIRAYEAMVAFLDRNVKRQ